MANTIQGSIKFIGQTNQVSDKFKKREFWIQTDGKYPQTVSIEAQQDFCDELDKFAEGENVTVQFDIRGREWVDPKTNQTKVFNTIKAFKIENNF